eukprot:4633074-Pyramimonas_sp.AAC.1
MGDGVREVVPEPDGALEGRDADARGCHSPVPSIHSESDVADYVRGLSGSDDEVKLGSEIAVSPGGERGPPEGGDELGPVGPVLHVPPGPPDPEPPGGDEGPGGGDPPPPLPPHVGVGGGHEPAELVALFPGGRITFYLKGCRFVATCEGNGHHRCSRERISVPGRRPAQGRPL